MALKLVVTKLVCVKLVVNLWRYAPPLKSYCKKLPVYAVGSYTCSLIKIVLVVVIVVIIVVVVAC